MPPHDDTREPTGLIGIGLLGSALAQRLLQSRYSVRGFDSQTSALEAFEAAGGQPAGDLRELGPACSQIILCLPNADIVEHVLQQLRPSLGPGTVIIDTTTGDPRRTRQSAESLAADDVALIDATVLGSSVVAREGRAVLMVGADTETLERSRPILQAISSAIHHVGPVGSGQEMKLVANLVLGLNRAVLAEGLHFAKRLGLELPAVLDVLRSGAAYSAVMDAKGRKMIDGDFTAQARLSQHLKDVRLILSHAADLGTSLPLSEQHRQLLESVEAAGSGALDNSAIIRAWETQTAGD